MLFGVGLVLLSKLTVGFALFYRNVYGMYLI